MLRWRGFSSERRLFVALALGASMISLRDNADYHGFGASSLASAYSLPTSWTTLCASNEATRQSIRERCPTAPGVYGVVGLDRDFVYVGQSKSLRNRLLSYFTGQPASAKVRRIVEEAKYLVWESAGHEFTALLRELELIRRWQPRLNVRGNPVRTRRAYLCVDHGPVAQAYLSAKQSTGERWTFGPVPATRQYRRSVSRLNDCFGLRACRRSSEILFSDQMELFSQLRDTNCARGELGKCLAPRATACSQAEYRDRVEALVDFLAGRDVAVLHRVEEEMQSAARSQRFELAARLRDTHEDLARLCTFLQRLREVHRYSFVYPARGRGGKENWYLIREGQVMAAERRPCNSRTARNCLKALDAVFPRDGRTQLPIAPENLDMVLLVAHWFRKYPRELGAVLSPEQARGFCG